MLVSLRITCTSIVIALFVGFPAAARSAASRPIGQFGAAGATAAPSPGACKDRIYVTQFALKDVWYYPQAGSHQSPCGSVLMPGPDNGATAACSHGSDVYVLQEAEASILVYHGHERQPYRVMKAPSNAENLTVDNSGNTYAINSGVILKYVTGDNTGQQITDGNLSYYYAIAADKAGDVFLEGGSTGPSGGAEIDWLRAGSSTWQNTNILNANPFSTGPIRVDRQGNLVLISGTLMSAYAVPSFYQVGSTPLSLPASYQPGDFNFTRDGTELWLTDIGNGDAVYGISYPGGTLEDTIGIERVLQVQGVALSPGLDY